MSPQTSAPASHLAPGTLLLRLSDEVSGCALLLAAIEAEVALLVAAKPARDRRSLDALQKIDLLAQTLGDLAACLAGLGQAAFPAPGQGNWAENALGLLRLDDLRKRLAGLPAPRADTSDSVDMF